MTGMIPANDMHAVILAPHGRDGDVAAAILGEIAVEAIVCADLPEAIDKLADASCAVIAEEALLAVDRRALAKWVAAQPKWSDFPFILLTRRGGHPVEHLLDMLGNVTVLERPFHPLMLANAAQAAIRARQRQQETEKHIAERQLTQERQALLIRELHHRVKNTLATVQALLGATARAAPTIDEFVNSFADRIHSLANTHNLLTEDYWQSASLERILVNELGHFDDEKTGRISLSGEKVELSADIAVPVSMAIHELTTNAVKYGALSTTEGRIKFAWKVIEDDARKLLKIDWTEEGGPLVRKPARNGFGSVLLTHVVPVQCSADIAIDYAPEGFRFRMDMPLPSGRLVPPY